MSRTALPHEKVDWDRMINSSLFHIPESLTHLHYTPTYDLMTHEEKLSYNHAHALILCEQFIYFEEHLLVPAVRKILNSNLCDKNPKFYSKCQEFIKEEFEHSDMFWKLLETAAPDKYPVRRFYFHQKLLKTKILLKLITLFPFSITVWIWLAQIFEERTINIYNQYSKQAEVDSTFLRVHQLHMIDEVKHLKTDRILISEIFAKQSPRMKRLNIFILNRIMSIFTSPGFSALRSLEEATKAHPRLETLRLTAIAELKNLSHNRDYQNAQYSRDVFPLTFRLMDQFSDMALMKRSIPLYNPETR